MMTIIDTKYKNGDLTMNEIGAYNKSGSKTAFRKFSSHLRKELMS